jgi:PAS domain S-box-containing protein
MILLLDSFGVGILNKFWQPRTSDTTRAALDQALDSMIEGIAVIAVDGKVLFANPAIEHNLGLQVGEDVRQPESGTLDARLLQALGRNERQEFTMESEARSVVVTVSPVQDKAGQPQGHLLLVRDVTQALRYERELEQRNAELQESLRVQQQLLRDLTEGKRSEEEAYQAKAVAEAANLAKSTFLANMSHELRTPLNAILGFVQLLQQDRQLSGQQRDHLAIVARSGEHLLSLVNDVLEMSKIEAGRIELNESNFDLRRMLKGLQEMFSIPAQKKGLALTFEIDADVPRMIYSDEGRLRQIVINLLGNAVKFTERGKVALTVRQEKAATRDNDMLGALHFAVADTGPGIAPDEATTLFNAFVQTQHGKLAQQGAGLGLAISREFVQLMGGEIQVSSEVGQGTTFSFHIPLKAGPPSPLEAEQQQRWVSGLAPNQPTYRILVVDDKWENRNLLIQMLKPIGFELREASDGQEAMKHWEEWEPHLILMDMRMPTMDGYEAARKIKSSLRGQAAVIIAVTASAFDHERVLVLDAGCDDFVRKPFRHAELFEKLNQHLGVRFTYSSDDDEDETAPAVTPGARNEEILTASALAQLPPAWVAELNQAANRLNAKAAQAVVEQIRNHNAPLANALGELIRTYRFDTILALMEETGQNV